MKRLSRPQGVNIVVRISNMNIGERRKLKEGVDQNILNWFGHAEEINK